MWAPQRGVHKARMDGAHMGACPYRMGEQLKVNELGCKIPENLAPQDGESSNYFKI